MASKNKMMTEIASEQDAVALLTADHKRVARLFAEFDALKEEGTDEEKSHIVGRICEELTVHTAIEEEIFYPAVRKAVADDDLVDEALVEHAGAKNLIAQLRAADPEDELYDAKVTVLGEQIEHHVTEEEGSMFPQARGAGVDTLSLGRDMLARKAELSGNAVPPPSKSSVATDDDDEADEDIEDGEEVATIEAKRAAPKTSKSKQSSAKKKASKKRR